MKEISSYQLVSIVISKDRRSSVSLPAPKVRKLAVKLHGRAIECSLGELSFRKMAIQYPKYVIVSESVVTINHANDLKVRLDKQLRFVKDEKLEDEVWTLWKGIM